MKIQKLLLVGFFMLVLGLVLTPATSLATEKTLDDISKIEKIMLAKTTKKIQYRRGKITSNASAYWKGTKKISLHASKLIIDKKGWYTLRVTTTKKKHKRFFVKLQKGEYIFSFNTSVKQKKGFCYLVAKSNPSYAIGSVKPEQTSLFTKGDFAYQVWQLESAGGKKFRIKNVATGKYLGNMWKTLSAGGKYFYLRAEDTKDFLYVNENCLAQGKRKNAKVCKFRFIRTKEPMSVATADETTTYPVSVKYGKSFSLKGMVKSYYLMQSLTAEIVKSDGTTVLQSTVNPCSYEYDLKGIDAAMTFGKLSVGNYCYRLRVKDEKGVEITVFERGFAVYIPTVVGQKTLLYNTTLIEKIGHQSIGTDLDKKACASYALAYCQAILKGETPTPQSYWLSLTDVSCVWSKGGYVTTAYASEQEVLQAAYGQIVAGKPCILHVTGNTSQHWVTIVGYKNVSENGVLSAANFIAIDPWDGNLITVSDKYKVKTTYRLAYSGT